MVEVSPPRKGGQSIAGGPRTRLRRCKPFLVALVLVLLPLQTSVLARQMQAPPPGPPADSSPAPGSPSVAARVGSALLEEVKRYASDTGALVLAPLDWDGQDRSLAAGALVIVGGTLAADHSLYSAAARNRSGFTDSVSRATTDFGAQYSFYIVGGLLAGGLAFGNH